MSSRLEGRILASAIEFRSASVADVRPPATFDDATHARAVWRDAVLLDAHEACAEPCARPPSEPHLHAIDLHTAHPGILVVRDGKVVQRRVRGQMAHEATALPPASPPRPPKSAKRVQRAAVVRRVEQARQAAIVERRSDAEPKPPRASRRRSTDSSETADASGAPARAAGEELGGARVTLVEDHDGETIRAEISGGGATEASGGHAPGTTPEHASRARSPGAKDSAREKRARAQERRARRVHDAGLREHGLSLEEPCVPDPAQPYTLYDSAVTHDRLLEGLRQTEALDGRVEAALAHGRSSESVTLYDGPPGTGKTERLLADVKAVVSTERDGCRIALIHPSNAGCVALYTRMHLCGLSCALMVPPHRLPPDTPKFARRDDSAAQIVVCTPAGRRGLRLTLQRFTHLFIDEAGQLPEMVVWALLDRAVRGVHLYGDARQLPGVLSQRAMALGLQRSLMERLIANGYPHVAGRVQHRMRSDVASFPSRRFYDGTLRTSDELEASRPPLAVAPYAFVPVAGIESRIGTSYANEAEAAAVRRLVRELDSHGEVVVLVPYLAQARLLDDLSVSVMTVDAFQGREADVVVLSLVRTEALGFWSDERRLNVALTRARDVMRVVGARWQGEGVLAALYADALVRNAVQDGAAGAKKRI